MLSRPARPGFRVRCRTARSIRENSDAPGCSLESGKVVPSHSESFGVRAGCSRLFSGEQPARPGPARESCSHRASLSAVTRSPNHSMDSGARGAVRVREGAVDVCGTFQNFPGLSRPPCLRRPVPGSSSPSPPPLPRRSDHPLQRSGGRGCTLQEEDAGSLSAEGETLPPQGRLRRGPLPRRPGEAVPAGPSGLPSPLPRCRVVHQREGLLRRGPLRVSEADSQAPGARQFCPFVPPFVPVQHD
jgi:hypothetical protein